MHWLKTARRLEERRIACTHLARSAGLGSKAKNQWMPQEYEGVREVGRLGVSVLGDVREAESERTCRVGKPWSRSELDHRFDNCVMVKLNAPISSGLREFIFHDFMDPADHCTPHNAKMSTAAISKPRKKAGRTPEEQAARDAREVAKAALPAFSPEAESAIQAQRSSPELPTKKRRPEAEALEELEVDLAAPEPLSKADARAARKKAKRADVVEDGIAVKGKSEREDGEAKVNGAAEVKRKPKKRNSIWIGNLSFKTTPDLLKDFVQRGVVELGGESEECVTRVNLPKKPGHGEFAGNVGWVRNTLPSTQAHHWSDMLMSTWRHPNSRLWP